MKDYKVCYISGHDLRYKIKTVRAKDERSAIEKAFEAEGRNFENRLVTVQKIYTEK